jgi:hypothetical protein
VTRFVVFNGDADGLCAAQQLRLAEPGPAVVVTGAKRENALLQRVEAARGDAVTVLDVSVAANRDALDRVLAAGATVRWFDHHEPGPIPHHPALRVTVDTAADRCTSLLVDHDLAARGGRGARRFARWAVVGAFGDNLAAPARALAASIGVPQDRWPRLQALGEALNHNAYGDTEADLRVHPAELHAHLLPFEDPLAFADASPLFERLDAARSADLEAALASRPAARSARAEVHVLPDAGWARRARGLLGNRLAAEAPQRAFAVVVPRADGGYTVSVRVPASFGVSAHALCSRFPGGAGRSIAAGIDRLPAADLDRFVAAFLAATAAAGSGSDAAAAPRPPRSSR